MSLLVPKTELWLTGPQTRAYQAIAPKTTVCLPWSRGTGKSHFIRNLAWLLVSQWDSKPRRGAMKPMTGVRIIGLMPTLKQWTDVNAAKVEEELTGDFAFLNAKINKTTWKISFPGGSWFQPFPAEMHSSKAARGLRADVVMADECDDIDPAVWDAVVRPWFTEKWSLKMRIVSGTPRRGRFGLLYHLHQLGLGDDPRYKTFHATYRQSPETVDPDEAEDARRNSPPAVFKREWECDFDASEGLVYGDVFNSSFHIREPQPGQVWSEILIGCDHGWEHPGAFLVIGVAGSGKDAVCHVIEEVYASHQPDQWWKSELKRLVQKYPRHLFYADPSQPRTVESYRQECKARVQECDNSVEEGIRAVADRFVIRRRDEGQEFARLFVSPRCKGLIKELGMYKRKRDPRNADAYQDVVDKVNDDACDALRYAIFNRFGRVLPVATPGQNRLGIL